MKKSAWIGLGLCITGGVLACGDVTEPSRAAARPSASVSTASTTSADAAVVGAEMDRVARALALAMNDAQSRAKVLAALRASPWNAHKLVLQEFVATPDGPQVLAEAAQRAGTSTGQLAASITALPALDFYAPFREQRRGWRATPGVVVMSTVNSDDTNIAGYDRGGSRVAHDAAQGTPGYPVLLLHPAEPKLRRNHVAPARPGDVIQDADENEAASELVWVEPSGDSIVTSMEDVLSGRDRRFAVLGAEGPGDAMPMDVTTPGADSTFIDYYRLYFRDGAGDTELYLKTKFYRPDGSNEGEMIWRKYDSLWEQEYYPHEPIIYRRVPEGSPAKLNVEVWEDDCGCFGNGDDYYGKRDFTWSDRDQTRSIDGNANIRLGWTPKPASQASQISVAPYSMSLQPGGYQGVMATVTDQYGYRMPDVATSWVSGDPSIAAVRPSGGTYADAEGVSYGGTAVYATAAGMTASTYVTVEDYQPSPCPPPQVVCDIQRAPTPGVETSAMAALLRASPFGTPTAPMTRGVGPLAASAITRAPLMRSRIGTRAP